LQIVNDDIAAYTDKYNNDYKAGHVNAAASAAASAGSSAGGPLPVDIDRLNAHISALQKAIDQKLSEIKDTGETARRLRDIHGQVDDLKAHLERINATYDQLNAQA